MKIITNNQQRKTVARLAALAAIVQEMSHYVPLDKFPGATLAALDNIAEISYTVGGVGAMVAVERYGLHRPPTQKENPEQ